MRLVAKDPRKEAVLMTRSGQFAVCIVATALVASSARADWRTVGNRGVAGNQYVADRQTQTALPSSPNCDRVGGLESAFSGILNQDLFPVWDQPPAPLTHAPATTGPVVRELPSLRGSLGLYLSAMLSLGGWHLVRSCRHLHLSNVPDWYHTGGPVQVGHATPFDLDFNSLSLCLFDRPVTLDGRRLVGLRAWRDVPASPQLVFLKVAFPRGPPLGRV